MNPTTMHQPNDDEEYAEPRPKPVPKKLALLLYTSHFLSTWNSRLFEFGSVLFLASIFPKTLLPMSIYALVRSAAAIVFAQAVGSWIDHGDRLFVVRTSILGQRIAVAASCGCFWALERGKDNMDQTVQKLLFAIAVLLACVEKLCSVMNLVSVERDWVVVITEGNDEARRDLNARMRRIDLLCKLLGPLAISTVAISSTMVAIWATLVMNLAAVAFEYSFIGRVYDMVPPLRRNGERSPLDSASMTHPQGNTSTERRFGSVMSQFLPIESLPFYFSHPAFLPSFSLSLLYLTVLSFSGQMITYLMSVGYTPFHVGIARTVSTIFELSATWVGPRLMRRIGAIRGGIWSLSWQMIWLAVGIALLFTDVGHSQTGVNSLISATGLAVGVALSRVGLWGYDLCAQNIIQEVGCLLPNSTVH